VECSKNLVHIYIFISIALISLLYQLVLKLALAQS
jgi:hypothetical protein